jgi:hypothetical protein
LFISRVKAHLRDQFHTKDRSTYNIIFQYLKLYLLFSSITRYLDEVIVNLIDRVRCVSYLAFHRQISA